MVIVLVETFDCKVNYTSICAVHNVSIPELF